MIKRLVGLLAAAAILAVIVFTILGAGSYTSFIERQDPTAASAAPPVGSDRAIESATTSVGAATTEAADSLATSTPQQAPAAE